jgi:hypothetical protein
MPLSRLCYTLLYNREESLFPVKDNDVHFLEDYESPNEDDSDYLFSHPKCK